MWNTIVGNREGLDNPVSVESKWSVPFGSTRYLTGLAVDAAFGVGKHYKLWFRHFVHLGL